MKKFKQAARKQLGIDDKSKLIPMEERERNFEVFKEKHFATGMADYFGGLTPQKGMKAYAVIEEYAYSEFGAIMIKRVLNERKSPGFLLGVNEDVQAGAKHDYNFIQLPINFPSMEIYPVGGQVILAVAVLHHEFEHTQYGKFINKDNMSLTEEDHAVQESENPVRILYGIEPRYIYFKHLTNQSINILTNEKAAGIYSFDNNDPKIMVRIEE